MRNRAIMLLLVMLASLIPVTHAAFVVDDQVVSDPSVDLVDPEYDSTGHHMIWQDRSGNLWVAQIDPETGDLIPKTGEGTLVDTGLAPIAFVGNGPEWAFGKGVGYITYTRVVGPNLVLSAASQDGNGNWIPQLLQSGGNRWRPEGAAESNPNAAKIAYVKLTATGKKVAWRNINDPATEKVANCGDQGARWVEGEPMLVTTAPSAGGYTQLHVIDENTAAITRITFDPSNKVNPASWRAPEFNESLIVSMVNKTSLAIWRKVGTTWTNINTLVIPSSKKYVSSPEPFTYAGRSYIVVIAAESLGVPGFPLQPVGPTEVWIAGIDANNPFFRRIDDPTTVAQRTEPEVFYSNHGPVIFYTEVDANSGIHLLRRASTGLEGDLGYDHARYGGPWAAVHRDNRNSGSTPFQIADQYSPSYITLLNNIQLKRPTMGPEGHLYFPYYDMSAFSARRFGALNSSTGATDYVLSSADLSPNVVIAASNLIDADGSYYLSSEIEMKKFGADGSIKWSVPVEGYTRSAQFTSDEKLVEFTWNGWVKVLDPADGSVLLNKNLTPWRAYPSSPSCVNSGTNSQCAYIRAPAVDNTSDVIFNTYTRSDSLSSVQAYSYDRFTHDISNKWRGESLNGVATAPVLSPDYTHVYVQDGDGDLVAMDTATGAVAWKFPLGFVSMEPPVVSASGYILPGGSQVDSPGYDSIGLIEDFGDHADWLFQDNTLAPLSSAAAGAGDRFVLAGRNTVTGELQIVVLDPTGIVATSPWGAALPASVDGLVLDTQGNLFVQTSGGIALKAFSPATVP